MRADEAELLDRVVKLFQSGNAAQWVDTGEAGIAMRILLHRLVHQFIGDLGRRAHPPVAATNGDQE